MLQSAVLLNEPAGINFSRVGLLQIDQPPALSTAHSKSIVIEKNDNAEGHCL